jgi:hypothetical protein
MKVGDLVKLKHQGNGQPGIGIIVSIFNEGNEHGAHRFGYNVMWDMLSWNNGVWDKRELVVVNETV